MERESLPIYAIPPFARAQSWKNKCAQFAEIIETSGQNARCRPAYRG